MEQSLHKQASVERRGEARRGGLGALHRQASVGRHGEARRGAEKGAGCTALPSQLRAVKLLAMVRCSERARQVAQWKTTHPRISVEQKTGLDAFKNKKGQSPV